MVNTTASNANEDTYAVLLGRTHDTPFAKLYFSQEMMEKYQPMQDSLQQFLDSDGEDNDAWNRFKEHYKLYENYQVFSNWDGKRYDIVLYGVSGYTGYLMMEYIKRVSFRRTKEHFTFAFAGRTASKVADMRDREFVGTEFVDTPVLRASFDDVVSMADLAKSARVLINVAGPYMLTEGEILIDACVHMGTTYLDISGEIPWTLRVLKLHEHALKNNAFVIPSAAAAGGYPDMCTFMAAKKIREDFNDELRHAEVYVEYGGDSGGGASGGTLKTRAAMSNAGDEVRKVMGDPFGLGGFIPARDRNGIKEVNVAFGTGAVSMNVRAEDKDSLMAKVSYSEKHKIWRGPFVYQYFDTRIIRRSNCLLADLINRPYGRQLKVLEWAAIPTDPSKVVIKKVNVAEEEARLKAIGKYYAEGEGPPLEDLATVWGNYMVWAQSEKGHETKCAFLGKDGYFETARVAIELAMTVLFDREKLEFTGGVLPPALVGGHHLVERINHSGNRFRIGDWFHRHELEAPPFL